MKVLITGAAGKCGSALAGLSYDITALDHIKTNIFTDSYQGSINDNSLLNKIIAGCNAVIHLAGASSVNASWQECLENNIIPTEKILMLCAKHNCSKIILASSNHVLGGYEDEHSPALYSKKLFELDHTSQPRPDSFYAISKLTLEGLGRFYAEKHNLNIFAIRIGALLPELYDNPFGYAEIARAEKGILNNSQEYKNLVSRLRAIWLSRRDWKQLITLILDSQLKGFHLFNAISNNTLRWLSIEYAKDYFGYKPLDNGALPEKKQS